MYNSIKKKILCSSFFELSSSNSNLKRDVNYFYFSTFKLKGKKENYSLKIKRHVYNQMKPPNYGNNRRSMLNCSTRKLECGRQIDDKLFKCNQISIHKKEEKIK